MYWLSKAQQPYPQELIPIAISEKVSGLIELGQTLYIVRINSCISSDKNIQKTWIKNCFSNSIWLV